MKSATPHELSALIKSLAGEIGFDLCGVTRAAESAHGESFRAWLAAGKHGAMEYLAKGVEERIDIRKKFPWAESVVCVALAYWQADGKTKDERRKTKEEDGVGRIARYAWGRDYHKVIEGKLSQMERRLWEVLQPQAGELQVRTYCDTGPILERELAQRAGLGWVGKHTLLIHPRHGSWFLLGEMILNLEIEPDSPIGDHCGTCRRCIEACPTDAITPYSVDGSRCISYLTLENRGTVSEEFHEAMGEAGYVAGCDICQEICPFNRQPLPASAGDFAVRSPAPAVGLQEILRWSEQEWDILTRGRAFRRAKYGMWRRNAEILAGDDATSRSS